MQEISSEKAVNKATEELIKQLIEKKGDDSILRRAWIKHTGSTWQPHKSTPLLLGCFDVIAGYDIVKNAARKFAGLTESSVTPYPVRKSDVNNTVSFDVVKVYNSWMTNEESQVKEKLLDALVIHKSAKNAILALDFSYTSQDGLFRAVFNELSVLKQSSEYAHIAAIAIADSTKPALGHESGALTLFQCFELQTLSNAAIYKGRKSLYDAGEVMLSEDV